MEGMNGTELFDSLYSEDVEGQKLNTMPGVDDLLEEYKKKFTGESEFAMFVKLCCLILS